MPGRLVAQDSAAELHRLPQGGGQVVLLPAVEDRRQVSNGAALLHLHLLVPDCRETFYLSFYFNSNDF